MTNTTEAEQVVTRHDVESAWRLQVEACDRFEQASLLGYPPEQLDNFRHAMTEATENARQVENQYKKQYDRYNDSRPQPVKRILAIHKNGKTVVNPETCPHDDVVTIKTGHRWEFGGDVDDDLDCYEQCLDCGWVSRDGETWAPKLPDYGDKDVPW